jgi:hypothetical protein
MSNEVKILSKIKGILVDVDPEDVLNDAKDYGLNVQSIEDFVNHPHNYVFMEKLMMKYATLTATYCAVSGATSGIGGFATTVALVGVDIAHMAAQLYRLNQKIAILNGFNPQNPIHDQKSQEIYLKALGFDGATQTAIRTTIVKVAAENTAKSGPSKNVAIRLLMEVAKLLGLKLTKAQTVKLFPFVGAALGGGLNYLFAKNAARAMIAYYKSDYFDRWQINSRDS